MILRIIILVLLICVIISLLIGFLNLGGNERASNRLLTSLTVRIALCVLIFLLLLYGFATGVIIPHPISPQP